jgi:hypothetical protein
MDPPSLFSQQIELVYGMDCSQSIGNRGFSLWMTSMGKLRGGQT